MQRKGEIDREIDAEASGDCFFAYITKDIHPIFDDYIEKNYPESFKYFLV